MIGGSIQVAAADFRNAVWAADPQRAARVLNQFINAVAGESVRYSEVAQFVRTPAV